jgi:hypothetical protein
MVTEWSRFSSEPVWIADVLQERALAAITAEFKQALDRGHRPVEETRKQLLVAIERHYLT